MLPATAPPLLAAAVLAAALAAPGAGAVGLDPMWSLRSPHCPGLDGLGTYTLAVNATHLVALDGDALCLGYSLSVQLSNLPLDADGCHREPHVQVCLLGSSFHRLRVWNGVLGGWDELRAHEVGVAP